MDANELRAAFTRFFTDRGHTAVPSASLIPHDPSVLFTIAGTPDGGGYWLVASDGGIFNYGDASFY